MSRQGYDVALRMVSLEKALLESFGQLLDGGIAGAYFKPLDGRL